MEAPSPLSIRRGTGDSESEVSIGTLIRDLEEEEADPSTSTLEEGETMSTEEGSSPDPTLPKGKQPDVPYHGHVVAVILRGIPQWMIAMGNDGKHLKDWIPTEDREFEVPMFRSTGRNLDIKPLTLEPLDSELRLEKEGDVQVKDWTDNIQVKYRTTGCDHVMFVGKKDANGDFIYYNLYTEHDKITSDMVAKYKQELVDMGHQGYRAVKDQEKTGANLLDSIGKQLRAEVIAGDGSDLWAIEVLYRIYEIMEADELTLVTIMLAKLEALGKKFKQDPTLDVSDYMTNTKNVCAPVIKKCMHHFEGRHVSKIILKGLYQDEAFATSHWPEEFRLMLIGYKPILHHKIASYKTTIATLKPFVEAVLRAKQSNDFAPAQVKKTKEISMLQVGQKLDHLQKQISNLPTSTGSGNNNNNNGNKRYSKNGNILLEGKGYPSDQWAKFSDDEKKYILSLKKKKNNQSGGGGGNSNGNPGNGGGKKKRYKVQDRYAKPADHSEANCVRDGKDADGKPTGKKEYYCPECSGDPNSNSKGAWNTGHGLFHPEHKHNEEFLQKLRQKQKGGSQYLAVEATPPVTPPGHHGVSFALDDPEDQACSEGGAIFGFTNLTALAVTSTVVEEEEQPAPFGFGVGDIFDEPDSISFEAPACHPKGKGSQS